MEEQEFGSLKFLKLKYKKMDQIIQLLCRTDSQQKIGSPPL